MNESRIQLAIALNLHFEICLLVFDMHDFLFSMVLRNSGQFNFDKFYDLPHFILCVFELRTSSSKLII